MKKFVFMIFHNMNKTFMHMFKNTQMNENITWMNLQFSKCQWAVPTFKNSLFWKKGQE